MDELLALAEQLIGYDTSSEDGVHEAAGFIKGWLDSRGVETEQGVCRGLPVITASHGDPADPTRPGRRARAGPPSGAPPTRH